MAWRSILVHLDDDPRCDARVDLAARIARDRDGRLVGVAPTGWVDWMYPVLPTPMGAEQLALALDQLRAGAEAAAQRFRERCAGFGLDSLAVAVDEGDAAQAIVERGHGNDLIVLGQPDPARPGHRAAQDVVERVVMQASRPALLVPFAGRFDHVGRRVVVAWDGGREAARAVGDALPLLTGAAEVKIVSFGRPDDGGAVRREQSLQALSQWLRRHGVQAQPLQQVLGDGIGIGEALLSHAADAGADLLVMGAYGHARWAERVLGGATRTLLQSMTVPVLMSH